MRQVTPIVCYEKKSWSEYGIRSITLRYFNGDIVTIFSNSLNSEGNFQGFQPMFHFVLKILKRDGYSVKRWPDFGSYIYDILWYEYKHPEKIERYYHDPEFYKEVYGND